MFAALAAVTVQSAVWVKENGAGPSLSAVEVVAHEHAAMPAAELVETPADGTPTKMVTAVNAPRPRSEGSAAAGRPGTSGPTMKTRWDGLDPSIMPAPEPQSLPAALAEKVKAVAKAAKSRETHDEHVRYYDGRPIRPARTIMMTVTAYSPDWRSCGDSADGITASTKSVWTNGMRMVAADTRVLPMGSLISVPGYASDEVVPVLDRGGAIKGKRLDVLYPTHEQARQWGVRKIPVVVWEYADGEPIVARKR